MNPTRTLELLRDWGKNAERFWYPIPGRPDQGCYGTGYNAWGVQTNQKYLAALATLALRGEGVPGLDRDWALARALAALRFSLASHLSGDGACTDGTQWGHTWISALGIERMMHGVYLLWPHLTEQDRADLRRTLVSEAEWLFGSHRRGAAAGIFADVWNSSGKNAPESNLWNGALLWRAAAVYPDHPHAGDWQERAHVFLVNSISVAADACDETVLAGKPVRERHVGANFFPNYGLDHHGYFNVGYMVICVSNAAMLHFDCALAGLPRPETLDHHQANLWGLVRRLIFSDGRLARIGGDSRVRYAYCQEYLLPALLYAADQLGDPHALTLGDAQLDLIAHEAAFSGDGSFYGRRLAGVEACSPYYYTRLESDRACALSQWVVYKSLLDESRRGGFSRIAGESAGQASVDVAVGPASAAGNPPLPLADEATPDAGGFSRIPGETTAQASGDIADGPASAAGNPPLLFAGESTPDAGGFSRLVGETAGQASGDVAAVPASAAGNPPRPLADEAFESSVAGTWHEPEHGDVLHRSPTRLAAFAWRAFGLAQGMCQPPDDGHLAEWDSNLVGQIALAADPHPLHPKPPPGRRLLGYHTDAFEGGFVTCGAVGEGAEVELAEGWTGRDLAVHHIAFAALPDGRTVVGLELIRLGNARVLVRSVKGLHLNIPNDLYNGFSRTITSEAGARAFASLPAEDGIVPLGGCWANVDGRLGVVGLYGADELAVSRSAQRRGGDYNSLFVDELCWPCAAAPRWADAGVTLLDVGWAVLAGANAAATRSFAADARVAALDLGQPLVRGAVVVGADGRTYAVVANFGPESVVLSAAALRGGDAAITNVATDERIAAAGETMWSVGAGRARILAYAR